MTLEIYRNINQKNYVKIPIDKLTQHGEMVVLLDGTILCEPHLCWLLLSKNLSQINQVLRVCVKPALTNIHSKQTYQWNLSFTHTQAEQPSIQNRQILLVHVYIWFWFRDDKKHVKNTTETVLKDYKLSFLCFCH